MSAASRFASVVVACAFVAAPASAAFSQPAPAGEGPAAGTAQSGDQSHPHNPPKPPESGGASAPAQQGHEGHAQPPKTPPAGVPPLTDEDRRAAFPDVEGHTVHDRAINYFVRFDRLEWQSGGGANGFTVDTNGWIGGDLNRFRFRAEGESAGGDLHAAEAHALYGRALARWWDVVAGVRQDLEPGPARTWAAVGIQGLAPYWFEVEATAYIGESARTHVRLQVEYELLLTNRLILQPLVEVDLYGKAIPESGIGAGLSRTEGGLRLRYEIRRELAPYVGVTWSRKYGGTADFAREAGEDASGARLAVGVRVWF